MENDVRLSLETHLFFARIMKEHSFFLEAGFPGKNGDYIRRADYFKNGFEGVLARAVELVDGFVGDAVLSSGELFTQYTLKAEEQSAFLTGIGLNTRITRAQQNMWGGGSAQTCGERNGSRERSCGARNGCEGRSCSARQAGSLSGSIARQVERLNQQALRLVDGLILFKEEILAEVKACRLFTANYPLLIEHILREAKLYRCWIRKFLGVESEECRCLPSVEVFWNQIMMEHALFIRGLLDPSEEKLIFMADSFALDYRRLLEEAKRKENAAMELTARTRAKTMEYRDFKAAGAKGLTECKITSIILPLLADHVLREANHYLRLLQECSAV